MGNKRKPEQDSFEEIVEQAKEGYDLRARLRGAPKSEKVKTLYTDEVTGKELGGDIEIIDRGIRTGQRRRWGVLGRIAELEEEVAGLEEGNEADEKRAAEIEAELTPLHAKAEKLAKKLESTAIVVKLVPVPDLVMRAAHHKAKKSAGIKGKSSNATEEQAEAYTLAKNAIILSSSIVDFHDKGEGVRLSSITVEMAEALKDELHPSEYLKVDTAMYELQLETSIGYSATDSADF